MTLLVIAAALLAISFVGDVLHEVAHSLAGALMGLGIKEVRVGSGPVLLSAGLGRTAIQLRLLPGRGLVKQFRPVERLRRLRLFVFIAAGPASDIALLVGLAMASLQPDSGEYWSIALRVAGCTQLYRVWSNLRPRMVEIDGSPIPNDGLQLLQIVTNRHVDRVQVGNDVALEHLAYEGMIKRYLKPDEPMPEPATRSPEILGYYRSRYIDKQGFGQEMLAALNAALATERPVAEEILLLESLIGDALVKADQSMLPSLDRWSARAFELGPDIATLKGTRGAALVELSRPAEGLALLDGALNGEKHNDCLVHAFRALGHFKLGEAAESEREFSEANALFNHEAWQGDDTHVVVQRIALTIGREFKSPTTWSVEAARKIFATQNPSLPPADG